MSIHRLVGNLLLLLSIFSFVFCDVNSPKISNCKIFSEADEWNRDISKDEVDPLSPCYISTQFSGKFIRLDFGTTEEYYGIPYVETESKITGLNAVITYGTDGADYSSESDKGPFPIPLNAPIEGGSSQNPNPTSGDRHVISLDKSTCMLYELYNTVRTNNGFKCSSSAKFNLSATNYQRPKGWTSADAAGLPILPGLLRYEEAATGNITHALRFTVPKAQRAYVYPGNHYGTQSDFIYPPYGQRFRLKSSFDTSGYSGPSLAILNAMKKYGIIFADQGSAIYISGVSNQNWGNTISILNSQKKIPGDQFEAVKSPFTIVRGYTPATVTCSSNSLTFSWMLSIFFVIYLF